MKVKIFSILDAKTGAYMQPFFALAIGQAARMFGDNVNDTTSGMNKHPEDYVLYHIGEFDDNSGELTPTGPNYVNKALDFISPTH